MSSEVVERVVLAPPDVVGRVERLIGRVQPGVEEQLVTVLAVERDEEGKRLMLASWVIGKPEVTVIFHISAGPRLTHFFVDFSTYIHLFQYTVITTSWYFGTFSV